MMKTKLTLFVTVLAAALFGVGCASSSLNKGLVAYYPFNGNAKDDSGNGNRGEVFGAELSLDRHSNIDGAYSFNGQTVISAKHHETLHLEGPMTVSVWIKPSTLDVDYQRIIQKSNETYGLGYGMAIWNGGPLAFSRFQDSKYAAGDGHHVVVAYGLVLDKWQQVVAIWDNDYKIFINGSSIPLRTHPYSFDGNAGSDLLIGKGQHGAFKGSIDDVRIYNRALSAEEVKALYDLEKPKGK
jgi:hypothetical protein